MSTPQTPRRSKRHQPTVFANQSSLQQRRDDKWSSPPLHTRSTVSTDLIDDEESTDDTSTIFYERFSRASQKETFSLGDTVLLATNVKKPSVGIIIALWEVSRPVTDSQMLAKVHWFLRPTELAQLRAKRGHLPVCHVLTAICISCDNPPSFHRTRFTFPLTQPLWSIPLQSFPIASSLLLRHQLTTKNPLDIKLHYPRQGTLSSAPMQ